MPKGVEHFFTVGLEQALKKLPKPVMPKGVEHSFIHFYISLDFFLPKPVMPKGVEHRVTRIHRTRNSKSAQTSDAERR